MKRAIWILLLGLVAGFAGSLGTYYLRTSSYQEVWHCDFPELEWLKREFHITEEPFDLVTEIHHKHVSACARMCQEAAVVNQELQVLLQTHRDVIPEIQSKMAESNAIRLECRTMLLTYLYKVSALMEPAQGDRFLKWALEETLFSPAALRHHGSLGGGHH